ncbi:two component transcriptional regulator, LytTR family [Chitinophaga rupis]|uniref:Two component transcriptional regulator, LytTR family n=1 Tax=Chitinophaga rupis TaxID=573321 RepID=A0A1H8G473_9BACT|nr:LytTR family DNA-binding domain-containing protein [Chitinophaga rupis]SEN38098.1 two component transcriptional regulator, LytTR family [Chitinophaga rupis]
MKINCIIVEDEPLAQERLKNYIQKLPYLNLLTVFDNGVDALVFLKATPVDLVFLDINIGELSGIQLLESARLQLEVIIITAYDEFALKGFDLNVTDYLLKPYTFERFLQAVEKAKQNLSKQAAVPEKKFIFVKTEYRLEKVLLQEILYIEGMRDYRRIHTLHKRIMTLQTFKEFEQEIPPAIICRVHKSYMVAIDKIDAIERDGIKIGEMIIPVSETYRKGFYGLIVK